jgi:exosortase
LPPVGDLRIFYRLENPRIAAAQGRAVFVTGIFQSAGLEHRKTWAWVFAALGIYWLALIHQLGAQWSVYEQYSYGWAVPFLCVYLLWQRIQKPEVGSQKSEVRLRSSVLYLLLALCALLYAPTRFFHEANPIWRLTSLLWTLEVIVFTLVLLHFAFGTSRSTLRFSHFAFPICFFLVAVPWPSGVEEFVVQTLTRLNVSATVEVLGGFGIPALQHANVIEVSTGNVGIDEACSGIRSFQATLMISLFLGEFYRLNAARRVVCVIAGSALSFLFNLMRTTLLTWVAARKGVAAIASWHDSAGITILVACFLTLWLAAMWLKRESRKQKAKISAAATTSVPSTFNLQPSTIRYLAFALLAWFVLVETGTQGWFLAHENSKASREDWSVKMDGINSTLTKVEIPASIRSQFRADENLEARWRDDAGNSWQLYYFRWLPARSLDKRVAIQLAKTHGPEICLPAVGMTMKADLGVITVSVEDLRIAFRQYLFLADGQPLHVFYGIYEDASGSEILANRRKDTASRIAAALAGSRNSGQRFLEIAVVGPENSEQAKAALSDELKKLVTVKPDSFQK